MAMKPRFSVKTLLWLPLLVAAFFLGRHSPEIETATRNWWAYTRMRWGAEYDQRQSLTNWPPNSCTVNFSCPVSIQAGGHHPERVAVEQPSDRQVTVTPQAEGRFVLNWASADGSKTGKIDGEVLDGEMLNFGYSKPQGMP